MSKAERNICEEAVWREPWPGISSSDVIFGKLVPSATVGKLAEAVAHVPRKIVYAEMAGDSVMVNEQVAVNQVWFRDERGNSACIAMPEENCVQSSKYRPWYPRRRGDGPRRQAYQPRDGQRVMRVAVESRVEVAHHITDDTGDATTGDHHVVHTVVVPIPSKMDMVMNCRMLGWSRTSCDHSVVALLHHTPGRTRCWR